MTIGRLAIDAPARTRRFLPLALAASAACIPAAIAQPIGPTPYLCAADSPFNTTQFSWFHRETFESGALAVPGVTPSSGSPFGPSSITDSVDCDDGVIDGSGAGGHSFFATDLNGVRFTFNAAALGALPTHAGIVWTDGNNPIEFEAFDAQNVSLGTIVGNHADPSIGATTAEDRFYGFIHPAGISSILIRNAGGGIELDHLQYGRAGACYANCDGSTGTPLLNVNDFVCFQSRFAAASAYADCDHTGTLNVNDFVCFQASFAAGCP